jgi:DNA (cytosine-5)-methyltransferase 1
MTILRMEEGDRRTTPVEWERLMGFPDNWTAVASNSARYKGLGNAVCVPVVTAIAHRLLEGWS